MSSCVRACARACGVCLGRHLSKAMLVQVVVKMEKKVVFARELDSQRERVLFLAHDRDLNLDRLQRAHLPAPCPSRVIGTLPPQHAYYTRNRRRAATPAPCALACAGQQPRGTQQTHPPPEPSRGGPSGSRSQRASRGRTARGALRCHASTPPPITQDGDRENLRADAGTGVEGGETRVRARLSTPRACPRRAAISARPTLSRTLRF
jgi:hypothetical protein